jgi:hypothetical protein
MGPPRTISSQRIGEDDPGSIALAFSLRLDAIPAPGLLLAAFYATLPTRCHPVNLECVRCWAAKGTYSDSRSWSASWVLLERAHSWAPIRWASTPILEEMNGLKMVHWHGPTTRPAWCDSVLTVHP